MSMISRFWPPYPNISDESKSEDAESLLPEESHFQTQRALASRHGSSLPRIIFLVLSHCVLAAFAALLGSKWRLDADVFCSQITSRFSPVITDLGLKYHTVQYNGSFFNKTVFRNDASPEVDAAWSSLGIDYRAIVVPEDQATASGLSPDQVRINDKYGGGYPANVEGLHHLHCLNLLRKALYYNYDYYHKLGDGAFKNEDHIVRYHVTHCLDILRQQLMCTVDVGMLGQIWWDPQAPKPFVDFNTKHKCRNFEEVRRWAGKRQMPEDVPEDFLAAPREGGILERIP